MSDKRQKNQLVLAFTDKSRSEAPRESAEGTETLTAKRGTESLAIGEQLMEEVCERENCKQALARVKANKGSAGVDGMTVHELPAFLKQHWPAIRAQLLSGTYKPQPVRRVEIPKPDGGGVRKLGIPSVLDRFIQQAVMQVLQHKWDRTFFQSQLRVSARVFGASGGGSGAAVHNRRLSLGGGSRFGEIFRPGQSRQTDRKDRRAGERQEVVEADPRLSASRSDGRRAGKCDGRRDATRRTAIALAVEHRTRRTGPGVSAARPSLRAICGR